MNPRKGRWGEWVRWALVCFCACLGLAVPGAQAATYAYRSDTFAYDTPSGTATSVTWHTGTTSPACTSFPNGDDDWADVSFPSGFSFTFGGTNYTSVRIYSNGILAFPPDTSGFHRDYTSQALPITAGGGAFTGCTNTVPVNLMVAYWLDIVAGTANSTTGASVQYELLGTAPNRRFVISWVNVKLYNQTTRYNFQVQLLESASGVNGNFRYQYTTGSSTGSGATVGVQLSTTDYTQYAYNQNFIDTTVGTAILWYPANQLAAKRAEYRLDESAWTGAAGEIKDTSGNLQNASRTTANVANVAGGKLCRGGTFTNNTSNTTIDAIATPITPANRGAIDFWYKSNAAWNAASSDAMLVDATTVAAKPFFLMKRANGALRFVVTDSAGTVLTAETSSTYSYAASTWHHIAVSWALSAGTNQTVMQIILDGVQVSTTGTTPFRSTSSGTIASLSTIYIGDNRTSGVTPSNGTPNGANGTLDEVYIYDLDINATQAAADMALTRPTCTTLDHFHIVHSGEVVNCGGAVGAITVEAHDANHALIALSGTTMQMSTSTGHGTWSSISTINPVSSGAGNGTGSYTFSNESSIVLGLADTFSESVNINLVSGAITEKSGVASTCTSSDYTYGSTCDTNLNFVDAGLLLTIPDHIADSSSTATVNAVRKSDSSTACVPVFANTTQNVTFTCTYSNPTTGTLPVRVGGKALNSTNSTSAQCDATGQTVSLTFNSSGVATPSLQYADVGKMTVNASHTAAGVTITGVDSFIAAPSSFAFSAIPAAPLTAGNAFNVTVTAKNASGATTSNFGKESPTASSVALSSTNPQPAAGNSTAIGQALTGFTAGAASTNLTWLEVGTFDLVAKNASYLGSGLDTTSTQSAVGRFKPAYFDTVVTQGCTASSFTYSGQPMPTTVTAKATGGTTTQNYAGATWARLVTLSDANAGTGGAFSSNTISAASFANGVGTASANTYTFTSRTTAPAAIAVRASEPSGADGVNSSGHTEGSSSVRSGRIRLSNAYGSERLALPVLAAIEYYDATPSAGWRTGTDACTTVAASDFAFNYPASASNNLVACETAVSAVAANPTPTPTLAAPGAGNTGWVDITLNLGATATGNRCTAVGAAGAAATTGNRPWLQFPWQGAVAVNPSARATFGVYKSPLIYRRENY